MVISLYVCEIPNNVSKKDIDNIFAEIEGFKDSRIKITNDKRKIAFIDYVTEKDAKFALETLQGFRFSQEDRGLLIKISDNSKSGTSQSSLVGREDKNRRMLHKKRRGDSSDASEIDDRGHNDYKHSYRRRERSISSGRESALGANNPNNNVNNINNSIATPIVNNKSSEKNISFNQSNVQSYQQMNPNPINPASNIIDLLNIISSNSSQNTNKPYTLPENTSSNHVPNPADSTNPLNNILECLQNLQTVQLISSLAGANTNPINTQTASQDLFTSAIQNVTNYNQNISKSEAISHKHNVSTSSSSNAATSFYNNFFKFDDQFKDCLKFKKNATNIVYVEGLPTNVTEREVAHIFRPFQGFKSVRLVIRDKNGEKSIICFADFESVTQSTICINTLQGYRFDKNDLIGLNFSYGVSKNK